MPAATTGEAVMTGKAFDVVGCIFQSNLPVAALIASSHPVGGCALPVAGATYCVPMYTMPFTTAGLVRETVPAANP